MKIYKSENIYDERSYLAGKAEGKREVVEWVEKQGKYNVDGEDVIVYPIEIYGADWQAKLKAWGIE